MPTHADPASDGRRRARVATDQKILAAVRGIITTEGPQAVSIDRVSEVSGVARTTLYRRYRNKYELLQGVAEQIAPLIPPELDISPAGFTRILERLHAAVTTPGTGRLMAHVLSADDESVATWRERFIGPRLNIISDFLDHGVRQGTFRADAADGMILELILGAVLAGITLHGELPPDWAERVADRLWPLIAAG